MKKGEKKKSSNTRWILRIFLMTVVISIVLTLSARAAMEHAGFLVSFLVLVVFIAAGIFFDMLGIAVAAADEAPFHAMAAHRERGAREAIGLKKNADRVSSFCNDVVGDIAGIVSGTTAAVIVTRLVDYFSWDAMLLSLALSGLVAGLTVGGKAVGKTIAMRKSTSIVAAAGRFLSLFSRKKQR